MMAIMPIHHGTQVTIPAETPIIMSRVRLSELEVCEGIGEI